MKNSLQELCATLAANNLSSGSVGSAPNAPTTIFAGTQIKSPGALLIRVNRKIHLVLCNAVINQYLGFFLLSNAKKDRPSTETWCTIAYL